MAITRHGSQMREPIEDTTYRIIRTWPDVDMGYVVLQDEDSKRELWCRSNDHAGYVVTIDGVGYEFIRSLPAFPGETR